MSTEPEEAVHLKAEDLIPERARCARTEDDQDTRYCKECMMKPCRWFSGWRPSVPLDAVPEAVVAEVEKVCSSSLFGKTQDHFNSRRKLFEEVDRLIRGRVREALPDITLEFKRELDRELGLEALRQRVNTLATGIGKDVERVSKQFEELLQLRIAQIMADAAEAITKAFAERCTAIVAEEVGRQLGRLLAKPEAPAPAEYRVRVPKKKRYSRG